MCRSLICRGDAVLRNPTQRSRSPTASVSTQTIDPRAVRDLVDRRRRPGRTRGGGLRRVEGLDVARARVELARRPGRARARGSRTTWASRPGISGQELAARAYTQALKFGAQMLDRPGRASARVRRRPYAVEIGDGSSVPARARHHRHRRAITAEPPLENLSRFEGAGVYYGATLVEAQLCARRRRDRRRRRQLRRAGRGVPRADGAARPHARPFRRPRGDDVPLPDPPHRGEHEDRAAHIDGNRRARGRDRHLERVRWRDKARRNRRRRATSDTSSHDDRRRSEHGLAARMSSRSTTKDSSRPDRTCRADDLAAARWPLPARPISSKRACPASSPSETCAAATSSGWRPPSAKGRSRFPWCTRS